jgi:FtsP/CotA-like multicopper oxidase with cupredoxin domain
MYRYHSHHLSQYTEGLWGVIIVHAYEELFTYDDERSITLSDWYHNSALENERGYPPQIRMGFHLSRIRVL